MLRSTRNALIAGLIAAVGLVGVSFAETGSLNPMKIVTPNTSDSSGPSGPTGDSGPTGATGGSGPSGATGPEATPTPTPHGTERSTQGCPEGFTGNHGQFVSSEPKGDRSEAAKSDCGKPVSATQDDEKESPEPAESPDANEGEGNHEHGDHGQQGEQHGNSHGDSGDHDGQGS